MRYERKAGNARRRIAGTAAWQLTLECWQATGDFEVCARTSTPQMSCRMDESADIFDVRGERDLMVSDMSLNINFVCVC